MTLGSLPLPYHCRYKVHGKWFDYYRRHGQRTRLPTQDSPDFYPAYCLAHELAEAVASATRVEATPVTPGSMRALVIAYRKSPEWRDLSPGIRGDYNKSLGPLEERYGHLPVATIPRQFVKKLRNDCSTKPAFTKKKVPAPIPDEHGKQIVLSTPRRANGIVNVLRLLLAWAIDQGDGSADVNPAVRPGRLRTGDGFRMWTATEAVTFLLREDVGEPMKRAAALGLYTGQRKQDCLAMTRSARKGGVIEVVPEKTRRTIGVRLLIPEHPYLTRILNATPKSDATTLLTRADGKPWGEDNFNHQFAKPSKTPG